jgi:flagellin-like hook-associated protein FlgL
MRISTKMGYGSFNNNVNRIQENIYFDTLRQITGKDIQSIGQAPSRFMDSKKLVANKNLKENYMYHNEYAISEMRYAEDAARAIADDMQKIRDLSIASLNLAYDGNVSSVAIYIKGIMEDMIRNANADFNGKYLFSGSMTTPNSITNAYPDMTNMPYQLIEVEKTLENPSGLQVVYKGNFEGRTINKDSHTNEAINMTGQQLFGDGGVEFFQPILDIYNTLLYAKGSLEFREHLDYVDREDAQKIAEFQVLVATNIDTLNKETAMLASRKERLETVNLQMVEEVTRLREVLSLKEDANMSQLLSRLSKEENALQYTLEAGSRLNRYSLFSYI